MSSTHVQRKQRNKISSLPYQRVNNYHNNTINGIHGNEIKNGSIFGRVRSYLTAPLAWLSTGSTGYIDQKLLNNNDNIADDNNNDQLNPSPLPLPSHKLSTDHTPSIHLQLPINNIPAALQYNKHNDDTTSQSNNTLPLFDFPSQRRQCAPSIQYDTIPIKSELQQQSITVPHNNNINDTDMAIDTISDALHGKRKLKLDEFERIVAQLTTHLDTNNTTDVIKIPIKNEFVSSSTKPIVPLTAHKRQLTQTSTAPFTDNNLSLTSMKPINTSSIQPQQPPLKRLAITPAHNILHTPQPSSRINFNSTAPFTVHQLTATPIQSNNTTTSSSSSGSKSATANRILNVLNNISTPLIDIKRNKLPQPTPTPIVSLRQRIVESNKKSYKSIAAPAQNNTKSTVPSTLHKAQSQSISNTFTAPTSDQHNIIDNDITATPALKFANTRTSHQATNPSKHNRHDDNGIFIKPSIQPKHQSPFAKSTNQNNNKSVDNHDDEVRASYNVLGTPSFMKQSNDANKPQSSNTFTSPPLHSSNNKQQPVEIIDGEEGDNDTTITQPSRKRNAVNDIIVPSKPVLPQSNGISFTAVNKPNDSNANISTTATSTTTDSTPSFGFGTTTANTSLPATTAQVQPQQNTGDCPVCGMSYEDADHSSCVDDGNTNDYGNKSDDDNQSTTTNTSTTSKPFTFHTGASTTQPFTFSTQSSFSFSAPAASATSLSSSAASSTTTAPTFAFTFNATSPTTSLGTAPSSSNSTSTPSFSFGTTSASITNEPTKPAVNSFLSPTAPTTTPSTSATMFVSTPAPSTTSSTPSFSFGSTPASTTTPSTPSFSFGSSSAAPASASSFGSTATSAPFVTSSNTSFGTSASSSSATPSFSFGSTPASTTTPTFGFGNSNQNTSSNITFGAAPSSQPPALPQQPVVSFGATPANNNPFGNTIQPSSNPFGSTSTPSSSFGTQSTNTFGGFNPSPLPPTTTQSTTNNPFGQPNTSTPASFSFGTAPTTQSFGSSQPQQALFVNQSVPPTNGFSSTQPLLNSAPTNTFQFGTPAGGNSSDDGGAGFSLGAPSGERKLIKAKRRAK